MNILLLLEVLIIIAVYALLGYGFWIGIRTFGSKGKKRKITAAIWMVLLVSLSMLLLASLKWLIYAKTPV